MTGLSSRLRTALLPVLLSGAFASPLSAAHLPDWAKALADAAPPLPPGVPDSPFRILLSEIQYSVQPDGSFRIRRRLATQALSVNTNGVDTGSYFFDETARITASRAWHLPPDDSARKSRSQPVDLAVGDNFLSGSKARVLQVDGVKKGSIVFFEFEATEKPYFLVLEHFFLEAAPAVLVRFQLETPEGWQVHSEWLRQKGPEPTSSGNGRNWELRDLPAPVEERLGPSPDQRAPLLVVNLLPPAQASTPAAFPDWPAVSRWYSDLARGRSDVTPPIEAAARQALPASSAALLDRVGAEGKMVRDKVRYIDVELGIGGFQPHAAQDTLAHLYGDCKDKATLFQAMLAAAGVPSFPILVNLSEEETVPESLPNPGGFNHLIAGVPLPADLAVPPESAGAVADAGDLGRLLIVDTTDEYTAVGTLSASLAGKRALVVAGEKGKLIRLPEAKPEAHRVERKIGAELQKDGSVTMERITRLSGDPAATAREEVGRSSQERRRRVEEAVVRRWPDASVLEYSTVSETSGGAFEETLKVRRASLPRQGAAREMEVFPGASEEIERVPLTRRKTEVRYEVPRTIRYESILKGLPASVTLPDPQSVTGEGWSITTGFAREGSDVKASWEMRLEKTRFEPAAFPELKKLWSAVAQTAGWVLEVPD
jgi:hypothetical protein